jgi:DNA-binding GntR family transcriptional regulator
VSKAREIHQQHLRDGTKLTGKTLGQMLGISDGYARRLLREIAGNQALVSATHEQLDGV